jgi:hypothetical protein
MIQINATQGKTASIAVQNAAILFQNRQMASHVRHHAYAGFTAQILKWGQPQ